MNLVTHCGFNERADLTKARQFETVEQIKEFLKMKFNGGSNFGTDNLLRDGTYREMAIWYDFRPWLKKYLVEYENGSFYAQWAPSKGQLREATYLSRKEKVYNFPKA